MKESRYVKTWDHSDSPLLWVELIYVGDTKKMPKLFGFKYDGHYFLSRNQVTTFYKNIKTEKEARKYGIKKYKDEKFIQSFVNISRKSGTDLIRVVEEILATELDELDNEKLFKIYDKFYDRYSTVVGVYRFCRPDFYEQTIKEIEEKLPEPKEANFALLLDNKLETDAIDDKIKRLAIGLKEVGEERFDLHKIWADAYNKANKLFMSIGERIGLKSLDVQNCTRNEIKKYLLESSLPDRREIRKRIKSFKLIYRDSDFEIKIPAKEKEKVRVEEEIKGVVAFRGVVNGEVVLFRESLSSISQKDMQRMFEGGILVTEMTSPDMIPVMKKAAAFITDDGGMLCHAAIIAREMKKPCIIGTKIATKVLKDGDLVEVDAEKGVVNIIKK